MEAAAPSFKQKLAAIAPKVPCGHVAMDFGAKAPAGGADMTTTKAIQLVSFGDVAVQHVAANMDCSPMLVFGQAATIQFATHGTIFTICAAAAQLANLSFLMVAHTIAVLFSGRLAWIMEQNRQMQEKVLALVALYLDIAMLLTSVKAALKIFLLELIGCYCVV